MNPTNKRPLPFYVIATIVVWAVILGLMWSLGDTETFYKASAVCGGFYIGMLAMYIAVHFYRHK